MDMPVTRWWAERAWLGGERVAERVLIETDGERVTAVEAGRDAPPEARRLPGLVLPGLANAHSHAFHRALRGRTHGGQGDFWSWRERMYALASRLEPDSYLALARAAYAEMALAGITAVGEFHYLHHPPGGGRYADPNVFGAALAAAAAGAGIRLTLLDACYLQADVDGSPLAGPQLRFGDGDPEAWAARVSALEDGDVELLGGGGTSVCLCPTTERDLADGIGPAGRLAAAGSPLALGSDSHAVVDLFEEARAVELDERLASERRGHHRPRDLLVAATAGGMRAIGWPEAGAIAAGRLADLVAVRLDTPRLAGAPADDLLGAVVFAASAADVSDVVVGGRRIVADGRHLLVGDVGAALDTAVHAVTD